MFLSGRSTVDGSQATPVVAIRGGAVRYDDQLALRDVDLTISAGEVVALLGPNGSGKSTLIRAVLGLVPLSEGTLELFGVSATRFNERARIGYVPQRHTVGGGVPATVEEIVASGRLARRRFLPGLSRVDREMVYDAVQVVGLTGKLKESVATLSGGQQRRALIARALASDPEVLVLDEPFAGVDTANQEILVQTLRRLIAEGRTLLLVTHELGPVESLIRRTVVLRNGCVVTDEAYEPSAHATAEDADPTELHDADPHPGDDPDDGLGSGLGLEQAGPR